MCGLFAVFKPTGELEQKDIDAACQALNSMEHRGPDDQNYFSNKNVFLGHNRLAIMDPSVAGRQPMTSPDGKIRVIFNGQIYNWKKIQDHLAQKGHHFSTNCDTESVLHAYMAYGHDFSKKMIGMWAAIIWDEHKKRLIITRDRIGIKPLYIYKIEDLYVFSSEIKAILRFFEIRPTVNHLAFSRYLTRGWLDDIPQTLFQGITPFPAGTVKVIGGQTKFSKTYWSLPTPQRQNVSTKEWRDLFISIVEDHVQSDVSVATTLSGGLDSTAINSVIAKELGRAGDIVGYSLLAPDIPDESPLISETVQQLGISHHYVDISDINYVYVIDEMLSFHDEPTYSAGQINQYIFRKQIHRDGHKVLLVGDGADEVLAGYAKILPIFVRALRDAGMNANAQDALENSIELTGLDVQQQEKRIEKLYQKGIGNRTMQEFRFGYALFNDDVLPVDEDLNFTKSHPELEQLKLGHALYQELFDRMIVDIPQVLRNEDRNGMASSLEVRPVFLDHRLIEFSWRFPFEQMMQNGMNKAIMRTALKNLIPKHVLENRKKFVRPANLDSLVYDKLYNPLLDEIPKLIKSSDGILKSDLVARYRKSAKSRDINEALVWLRVYMVARWNELHGASFKPFNKILVGSNA